MTTSRHPARSILMLGDSLTRGFDPSNNTYPAWTLYMLLGNKYKARGTAVINAAGSGYNTRMMKRVLPDIHSQCQGQSLHPSLVTIWAGVNDCVLPSVLGGSQHVFVEEYKQNLTDMIAFINQEWPLAKILLITATPSIPEKWLEEMTLQWKLNYEGGPVPEQNRTLEQTKLYVEACIAVAERYKEVCLVDAWNVVVNAAGGTSPDLLVDLLPDGLHLSGKGHKLIFDEFERVMKANLGEWDPDSMKESDVDVPCPLALPDWRDLAGESSPSLAK